MRTIEYKVGIGLMGPMRNWLELQRLHYDIRWHEGRGWISRKFTIVGPAADIAAHSLRWRWLTTSSRLACPSRAPISQRPSA